MLIELKMITVTKQLTTQALTVIDLVIFKE